MARSISPLAITSLLEIKEAVATKAERPLSTIAFDWLYVLLSLLLTVGIMMDVWSHVEFGPDQSLFNEYHLLFIASMSAILTLLGGMLFNNMRNGYPLSIALPQGYGLGLLATLAFGAASVADLGTHALFGFESGVEALTSPSHLGLFVTWCLILYAPVNAARARVAATGRTANLRQSLPRLIAYGCMMCCVYIPLMEIFPMGGNPIMTRDFRPADDFHGWGLTIAGTLLQTLIAMAFVLWAAREFKMPVGGYTISFGFYGLFITLLEPWQMPLLMFGGFGILLDLLYFVIKPDATRRARFMLFATLAPLAMWAMMYGTLIYIEGANTFYLSGYNLFGSIGQATILSVVLGYLMSMTTPTPVIENSLEVAHV